MASVVWTICITILATILTSPVEGNGQPGEHSVEGILSECGSPDCSPTVYFDTVYEVCCGGIVYRKEFNQFGERLSDCCPFVSTSVGVPGAMYSTETQDCCNLASVIDKSTQGCCSSAGPYELATQGCCGGQIYDKEENICCNDALHSISEGNSCCGNVPFDNNTSTCCGGEVKKGEGMCCGNDIYQPNKDLCCQTIEGSVVHTPNSHDFSTRAVQCCGTNTYRPDDDLCCNMVVHTKDSASTKCCGNSTYDENTEICCQGYKSQRDLANGCCGRHPFNEDNEVCCWGVVTKFEGHGSCCNGEPYNREFSTCVDFYGIDEFVAVGVPDIPGITNKFLLSENNTAYLSTEQFECGGQLHRYGEGSTSCCAGAITYDSSQHLCCSSTTDSIVVTKVSPDAMCCGESSFNPNTQGCCNGSKPFNSETQQCCPDGGVRGVGENCDDVPECSVRRGNDKLCVVYDNNFPDPRYIPYNSKTAVCTTSGVKALPSGLASCGDEVYRTSQEICCQDKIVQRFGNNMQRNCCETFSTRNYYTPEIETCYNWRIYSIPSNVSEICSGYVYDSRYYGCDVAGHIRRKEEILEKPDLCYNDQTGPFYFNKLHHSCCSGHLIAAGHTCCDVSSECCQPNERQGYNTETHVCCDGNLVAKVEGHGCCGTQTYDTGDSSKLCCMDTKLYDSHNGNVWCEGETITGRLAENEIVCRGNVYTGNNIDCCGAEKYDLDNEVCCRDFKYTKTSVNSTCCGSVEYDPSGDALCCDKTSLYQDPDDNDACCGNVTYDTIFETCCSTGGIQFVTSEAGQCCSNDEEFDSSLHTCCDGLIHNYIAGGECCGNHVIRDPIREFCCGGQFVRHYGDKRCCHGRTISLNEMCSDED